MSLEIALLERRVLFSAAGTDPSVVYAQPLISISALNGVSALAGRASASGLTPNQIRTAYGMSQVKFNGLTGYGAGQTIAIIDAYDNPTIVNDLQAFDRYYGIINPPSFKVLNQNGGTTLPKTDPSGKGNSWAIESALDVQWAHVMAPQANIILFEANSSSYADLLTAVNTARNTPGVTVVSMSFGSGEFSSETLFDSYFTTPVGHTGVTFVASTGDNGAPGGYPAFSSNVVAVGGTTLSVTAGGGYISESAWSSGGGGTSRYEVEPVWQRSVQTSGRRTTPDLSMDANPYSGVPVFDSWDFGTATPWIQVGGTSLSAPLFGGIVATANQGRVLAGATSLDGATQTLPALYSLSSSDFHDVVSGSNGNPARAGYDLATGRGTPVGNLLIADLVSYGATPARKVVATPTTTLTRSQPLGSLFESSTSSAATTSSAPVSLVSPAMTDTAAGLVPTLWARSRRSDFAAAV